MMTRLIILMIVLALFINFSDIQAQSDEPDINIFGYFQSEFQNISGWKHLIPDQNSFLMQQLNLFLQRDINKNWTSFVNFEILNSFASQRNWGEFNLEEAWVRYTKDERFNLKLGLLIPTFNNLNEIKNRTPLLPYIIRPLAYETSMKAYLPITEFTPERAYVQSYGFFQIGKGKLDYAAYIGNSPNVLDIEPYQTGLDTTTTFLFGGRVGIRYKNLKAGLSVTRDELNQKLPIEGISSKLDRKRIGIDISYNIDRFFFEGEFINVNYDEGTPGMKINREFYYAIIGAEINDHLIGYTGYNYMTNEVGNYASGKFKVPYFGMAYHVNDRMVLKWQYAYVDSNEWEDHNFDFPLRKYSETAHYFNLAVSVYF
ncbi:MAG: hypothetical protein GY863_03040 [bacterium]|nr:hypothetical protein [bacterium]